MAKVTGPMMSIDARGKFAGTLVFSGWKGRAYVRQLVTPSNPHAADQESSRNRVRALGAVQHFFNSTALIKDGETLTDKARLTAAMPAGYAWNGWLVEQTIGKNDITYTAAMDAWDALAAGEQTAWDDAAAALTPAIPDVAQTTTGGDYTTSLSAGNVWFIAQYGLYVTLGDTVPGATPPTYA